MISTPPAYTDQEIRRRLNECPRLASLERNNRELLRLVQSEQSLTSQIAEIVRRDPSLCTRLLRMVNSVYYRLSVRANSIEDAVFFLGLRQIRELALATPLLEDLEKLQPSATAPLPWKELWAHSIGTATLTREILSSAEVFVDDDTDYLAGLLHHIGKVVMAYAFPRELKQIMATPLGTPLEVCALELQLIGWDHAEVGAYYLNRHQVSPEIVDAVRCHHHPNEARQAPMLASAVQVADALVRYAGIGHGFETTEPVPSESWLQLEGWRILHQEGSQEALLARASIANAMQRLPAVVGGLA